MLNVVSSNVKPVRKPSKSGERKLRRSTLIRYARQKRVALGVLTVGAVITAVSLTDQAHGVTVLTGIGSIQAAAMAVGIDCGMIGAELAEVVTVTNKVRSEVHRWSRPMAVGTALLSAVMNSMAFLEGAGDSLAHQIGSIVLGVAIPAAIFTCMRIGTAMLSDYGNKAV